MRSNRQAIIVDLMLVVAVGLWSAAAAPLANAAGAPRYSFREGQKLTYQVALHSVTHAGPQAGDRTDVEGKAVLEVRSVDKKGVAEIAVTASGKGKIVSRMLTGLPPALQTEPYTLIFTVKPNGSITGLRDADGNQATGIGLFGATMTNAGAALEMLALGGYTLFGFQLPQKVPAPGKQYTGYTQEENTKFNQGGVTSLELKPVPVKYTFVGPRKYKGHDCLAFSGNSTGVPQVFYFDDKSGQLVGIESHVKKAGASKTDADLTAVLVKVE
jgi:hypothetical protein